MQEEQGMDADNRYSYVTLPPPQPEAVEAHHYLQRPVCVLHIYLMLCLAVAVSSLEVQRFAC
jgi:hypothetical protein